MEISEAFLQHFSIASLVSMALIGGLSYYSLMTETSPKPKANRNRLTVGGLINDGNTCFMNSVIQAFCSMKTFQDYINSQEQNGPVTEALQKLIDVLAIKGEQIAIRPTDLIQKMVLGSNGNIKHLLGYQQQDAQEFFQHLSSLVTNEQSDMYRNKLSLFDPTVSEEKDYYGLFGTRKISWRPSKRFRSPLTGLIASGILCKICHHQTALRHNTFDNLALPIHSSYLSSVHSMIKSYTSPELIEDYSCEKCSLVATLENSEYTLKRLLENNSTASTANVSKKSKEKSKKRKNNSFKIEHQLRKSIETLRQALETCDFDIKMPTGITKVKISSPCEKQTILACPPQCLCLHMQRSMMLPSGRVVKSNSPVYYENILDINDLVLGVEKKSIITTLDSSFVQKGIFHRFDTRVNILSSSPNVSQTLRLVDLKDSQGQIIQQNVSDSKHTQSMDGNNGDLCSTELPIMSVDQSQQTNGATKTNDMGSRRADIGGDKAINLPLSEQESKKEKIRFAESMIAIHPRNESSSEVDPLGASFRTEAIKQDPRGPFIYKLSAVILHYGNHDSGHFVTLRRVVDAFQRDIWFRVSDANVERIADVDQEVFDHGSRFAYMIFYERL